MPDDASWRLIGKPAERIDGRAKVTGKALYPSDEPVANPAYAFLVTSSVARGRIARFDLDDARAVSGVLDILTYHAVGHLWQPGNGGGGPQTRRAQGLSDR